MVDSHTANSESDQAVINLFKKFFEGRGGAGEIRVDIPGFLIPTTTGGEAAPGLERYILHPQPRATEQGGKYARVTFYNVYDRRTKSHEVYVVKRNIGIDAADERDVSGIEAKVLQELKKALEILK